MNLNFRSITKGFLDFKHFGIYNNTVHMFIIFIIDFTEHLECFLNIFIVDVLWCCVFDVVFQ